MHLVLKSGRTRFLWLAFVSFLPASSIFGQAHPQNQETDLQKIVEQQQSIIQQQSQLLERQMQRLEALEAKSAAGSSSHANIGFAAESRPMINGLPVQEAELQDSTDAKSESSEEEEKKEKPKYSNNGYDGGFTLTGPINDLKDGKPKFTMKIGSWGQLRHNYFDSTGPTRDQNDLEFERLRLTFGGYAYNPNFTYSFQFDADSDSGAGAQNVDMLDYYGTYDIGADLFGAEKKRLAIRFGRWKIGFNRAREESGTMMQFSDRSTASVIFDFDRSIAVGLLGEMLPFVGEKLNWEVALTNGIDNAGFRPSRAGQLDRNLGFAARTNWLVTGDWGKDGHADLEFRDIPALRLGSGFTYTRPDVEGTNEFNFPRVLASGANINTALPAGVTAYNLFMFANDINFKYQGFSLVSETYYRQISGFTGGGLPSFSDYGYWNEIGYFIVPEKVQLIARHAHVRGDSGTLGAFDTSSDEIAGGVVCYFNKHNSKLTFDVTNLNGASASDSAINIRPGDDGTLFRTTYQWKF